MNSKDQYVRMMQAKLDEWSAEVDVLTAKANHVAAGLKVEYGEQIESLAAQRTAAKEKLAELQKSGAGAWEDLKSGMETAWSAMGKAIDAARSRFN